MKKLIALILAVCMLAVAASCYAQTATVADPVADKVLIGKVVTMDDNNTVAEAIAVKDGKIIFVGGADAVGE